MGFTRYFKFKKLKRGDVFSSDDYAFSNENPDIQDTLFYRVFNHHHDGVSPTQVTPDVPLVTVLSSSGGTIGPSKTIRYKYTLVDQYGTESAPSPEVTITTPPQILRPGPASISYTATGGTLSLGTYSYALSAWTGSNTNQTIVGQSAIITISTGNTNAITLTLPSLSSGAQGFNIYRRGPNEIQYSYLTSIDMISDPVDSYEDDGTVTPNYSRIPSNVNTTNSSNSIELTISGATPTVPDGFTWRIYRTYDGSYNESYLTDVVEETSEGSGIITPVYTDTGIGTDTGSPPSQSTVIPAFSKIDLATETQGTLTLSQIKQVQVETFFFPGAVTFGDSKLWVCEYDEAQIIEARAYLADGSTPASDILAVEIQYFNEDLATPDWTNITVDSSYVLIDVANSVGPAATIGEGGHRKLVKGEILRIFVAQSGGGATPTDSDLTVHMKLYTLENNDDFTFDA